LPSHAEVIDGFARELGLIIKQNRIDYLKEYVPVYRNGQGQLFEGWSYGGGGGGAPDAVNLLANEFWSKSGTFKGFSVNGKNDQSGDPQLDALFVKARLEPDTEKRRVLTNDIQRYLAKSWYTLPFPGQARELTVAWPCIGDFRVYQGARNNYRLWVDDTKPPFKSA
jgi:ABC-type transport system substrate-binding protein